MSTDTAPIEADILAVLRAGTNIEWHDSEMPEDSTLVVTNGLFSPYGVVYFGGPVRTGTDRSLVSTRHDLNQMYCTVQINAPRAAEAKLLKDAAVDLLNGYRPPEAGELSLEGGMGYSRNSSSNELPTVYVREIGFSCVMNLAW